jgi:hypothetical protein
VRVADECGGALDRLLVGADPAGRQTPSGSGRGCVGGQDLYLVGQNQVSYAPAVDGMFHREAGQLGMIAAGLDRRTRNRHVLEDRGEVEILEGTAAEDLRRDLAGDREDW